MAPSAPQTTVHNHSSELLEHLMAEEISLQVQKIAEGLQREGWPMALVKRFMHVAVEDLPEWSLSKAPLTIQGLQSLKALQVFWMVMGRKDQALDIFHSISVGPTRTAITVRSLAKYLNFLQQYLQQPSKRCARFDQWVQFFAAWVAASTSKGL